MRVGVRTVRQLLSTVLRVNTTVTILIGTIGCLSIFLATRSVNFLTDELNPATLANSQVMQQLTNAETEIRAFALTNDQVSVDAYRLAISDLAAPQVRLHGYAAAHPNLKAQVQREERAAQLWLRRTLRGIALLALIGTGLGLYVGRRVARGVRAPLAELEAVVARRRGGDEIARAAVDGPREIRNVATEFNQLCEENERARSVSTPYAARCARWTRRRATSSRTSPTNCARR